MECQDARKEMKIRSSERFTTWVQTGKIDIAASSTCVKRLRIPEDSDLSAANTQQLRLSTLKLQASVVKPTVSQSIPSFCRKQRGAYTLSKVASFCFGKPTELKSFRIKIHGCRLMLRLGRLQSWIWWSQLLPGKWPGRRCRLHVRWQPPNRSK